MNLVMKERSGMLIEILYEDFSGKYFRFGKGILSKLVDTVCQLVTDKETTTILDIGTGNGHVIQRLLRRGYMHITGIDYSEKLN